MLCFLLLVFGGAWAQQSAGGQSPIVEQGKFTLHTGNYEGAPAGDYDVTVIKSVTLDGGAKGKQISTAPPETTDALKGAYADKSKSGLRANVKEGANKLEPFRLDK